VSENAAADDKVVRRMQFEEKQFAGLKRTEGRRRGDQKFTSLKLGIWRSWSNQSPSVTATMSRTVISFAAYRPSPRLFAILHSRKRDVGSK
jgi:hypothetical protein